ncbi:kinase-like domain-containing protein [Clohesyomyces aquaticus]|uniref:Kinase-like domain-containing protein n=1 Tax=Clohesyomyces aquaticus TaxID=1231657 RepID=A0A1Y1ZWF7_9PLEO|nr:kinase-like domain-containing protein [Clohesyomyces aquaticus]
MNPTNSNSHNALELTSEEPDPSKWDWADRGTPHVQFSKDEQLPFQDGDIIGHGVNGPVVQTVIKGVCVAVKRIYCRQGARSQDLQEIEIIRKLSHPHIIKLAGSFTRGQYLGILLYPVATCDLATFLEDIDFLQRLGKSVPLAAAVSPSEYEDRISRCATISRIDMEGFHVVDVIRAAKARLWESYSCITNAMLYLHQSSIRHKDLKPLNILLSRHGLWITDFGHSTDFSDFSNSATSGGERGTIKYCAPEVAAFERSGRSADVFSLGCIFFEMAGLSCFTLEEMKVLRSSMDGSFHRNLHHILPVFDTFGTTDLDYLPMSIIRQMLSTNPEDRPDLALICSMFHLVQAFSTIEPETFSRIHCLHHFPPPSNSIGAGEIVEELLITVGNTCNLQKLSFTTVGERTLKTSPVVMFVDCSNTDYIDVVIFLEHSSCSTGSFTVHHHIFAETWDLWGTFTQAVLLVLKPGYYWRSELASAVPWGAEGTFQSMLPLTWDLQIDKHYASKITRVPVSGGLFSEDNPWLR